MKLKIKTSVVLALCFIILGLVSLNAQDISKLKFPKLHKLEIPKVEKITLDNGLRLYLLEDKSLPVLDASVRINCGSYLEPADKVGLAKICGTVMRTGGTSKWSGDKIDELLEGVGGSVETSIGLTSGQARVNILSEYTDLGLDVLSQVLRHPIFVQDKIDLAKVKERSAISRRNDNPQQITSREFKKIIYGPHSVYARTTEYTTIDNINRDDLIAFHDKYFQPQNIQIAIWGDFDKKDIIKKIKQYFGDWKKGNVAVPPLPKVDYQYKEQVYYVDKKDVNQTNIAMGHIGGYVTDADYPARIVMNNILGGSFGSRLFNSVRSREGLAYAVFGVYTANIKYPGIFYGFASTKSKTTVKTIKEMIKEIKRMQTVPPTEDEMKLGKDGYLNSFVFKFDTKAKVINRLMNYDFNGLPEDFLFKVKEGVEKVTSQDVIAAAQKNLHPDKFNILVVGNGQDFDMPLDQMGLGTVDTIDITIPSGKKEKKLSLTPENLKKGKALLAKAVTTAGGLENFKKVKSFSLSSVFTLSTPQGEFPINIESINLFPDKSRDVMSMMGQKMYQIRNGKTGWATGKMGKVSPMTEDDIIKSDKEMARNTIIIFQQIDNPPYQAVYNGSGEENKIPVEYVSIIDKDGKSLCRLGIDKDGQLVSKSYWGSTPMGDGNITETYSDFKEIEGIKIPMTVVKTVEGKKIGKLTISEFNINAEIPPDA
ncbi:MAG: insulinase family protein, partial [FCB group bacterium]|nr:insulinase family protein [FCB group bacterium]